MRITRRDNQNTIAGKQNETGKSWNKYCHVENCVVQ